MKLRAPVAWRRSLVGLAIRCGAVLGLLLAAWVATAPDPAPLLAFNPAAALEVVDRHGGLLRLGAAPGGARAIPVAPDEIPPYLLAAVLAAEDRRFFVHPGIDPVAMIRAAGQNVLAGRVVSGASTITMQLARLLQPRPRGWAAKVAQMRLALRLEAALAKREILAAYLSRAPMGNRAVGYAAGSLIYLGKPLRHLSPAEAALLAVIPRAPSRLNPWAGEDELLARRDAVLARMRGRGMLAESSFVAALAEPLVLAARPLDWQAPHFVARALAEARAGGDARRLVTTLDGELQRRVEVIVARALTRLGAHGVKHLAVAVLDVRRGEWLALEGSGGFAGTPGGQLDGSRAPRQPGSALKPFTYAAAFDQRWSPADLLADLPAVFPWRDGTWTPRNYDGRFRGPLRAREALACSVNVPAVRLLAALGPEVLVNVVRRAGIATLDGSAGSYGLGLTLGAGEVRLDELTNAYAALLRGGQWRASHAWRRLESADGRVLATPPRPEPRQVCSPEAAAQVVDILADPQARAWAFGEWSVLRLPFAAAVKTGTSEGFRDNWCIGGTGEVAVGVWCGDFDRWPMGNLSGVTGAGAVWREVMLAWAELAHPGEDLSSAETLRAPPATLVRSRVCALSGLRPTAACPASVEELLRRDAPPRPACDWHDRTGDGRTIVRWPAPFLGWALEAGLVSETSPPRETPLAGWEGDPRPRILSPAHNDAFVLSPELPRVYQTLLLRCAVPPPAEKVTWLVNGQAVATVASPFSASWMLQPGVHRIEAQTGSLRSAPAVVTVYGR